MTPIDEVTEASQSTRTGSMATTCTFSPHDTSSKAGTPSLRGSRNKLLQSFEGTPLFVTSSPSPSTTLTEHDLKKFEICHDSSQMIKDFKARDTMEVDISSTSTNNDFSPYRPSFLSRESYLQQIGGSVMKNDKSLTESRRLPSSSILSPNSLNRQSSSESVTLRDIVQNGLEDDDSSTTSSKTGKKKKTTTSSTKSSRAKGATKSNARSNIKSSQSSSPGAQMSDHYTTVSDWATDVTLNDTNEYNDTTLRDSGDVNCEENHDRPGRRRRKPVSYKEPTLGG